MKQKKSQTKSQKLYELATEAIACFNRIMDIDKAIEDDFQGNEMPPEEWLKLHYISDRFYRIAHENRPF